MSFIVTKIMCSVLSLLEIKLLRTIIMHFWSLFTPQVTVLRYPRLLDPESQLFILVIKMLFSPEASSSFFFQILLISDIKAHERNHYSKFEVHTFDVFEKQL